MQKTRIIIGAAGAAALALAAGGAYALGAGGHDPMTMFDKDGNQALSLAEVRAGAQAMFAKVDADKDGRVTAEEFHAHHRADGPHRGKPRGDGARPKDGRGGPPHGRGPMHLDADGDGAVSLAEMQGQMESHFARADADRDGSVSRSEMDAAHRAMRGRH